MHKHKQTALPYKHNETAGAESILGFFDCLKPPDHGLKPPDHGFSVFRRPGTIGLTSFSEPGNPENPEIQKTYWMNQEMQLKQHLKTTTKAFKCMNQIRKWSSFDFSKLCWHFFHENLKMQIFDENPEIRKIYWMNSVMQLKLMLLTATTAFKYMNQTRKYIIF